MTGITQALPALADEVVVEPPRPSATLAAPYPAGAQGDANVVLEVEIDTSGHVIIVRALEGRQPFADEAEKRARDWTFEPARRNGVAIRARFRIEMQFHEPAPPQAAPPARLGPTSPAVAAAAAPPVQAPEEEVRVQGQWSEPSETRLTITEAREVPGGMGDPVLAIAALPGVASMRADDPYLYVRGAPPGNTGFLVDGVRAPLLFHGGVATSIVQAPLVDAVDFFPSAAPARYGGFAGGILELQTRPPAGRYHGEVAAKAYEAGALVESPFASGRGSALASARYGYPQLVLAIASPTNRLGYWDYQSRTTWNLGESDRVGLFAFGSHDRLGEYRRISPDTARSYVELLASDFHRLDLRYDRDFGESGQLRAAMTMGWSTDGAASYYVDDWMVAARLEGELRLGSSIRLRVGAQFQRDTYSLSASTTATNPTVGESPTPTNLAVGTYADVVWPLNPRLEITPGLRFDLYHSSQSAPSASGTVPTVEPRCAARLMLAPGVVSLTSVGLAHQFPLFRVGDARANAVSVPAFPAGDVHLQTSSQASQGIELSLPAEISLRVTAFGSWTKGMSDLPTECNSRTSNGQTQQFCADGPVDGTAYGGELWLRRSLSKRLTGWLSYTLSRSTERYVRSTSDHTVFSPFDHTHVLSAVAAYDFGRHWRAGARLVYNSGSVYSQLSNGQRIQPFGEYRLPAFGRVDVRLEKRWVLGQERSIALVAEMLNATLSRDYNTLSCSQPDADPSSCRPYSSVALVVIPSLGVEASF